MLLVDDDPAVGDLVRELLTDEGYVVSVLGVVTSEALHAAVERLEPECILLDSRGPLDYGDSWRDAAWARARAHAVPVVMFTASAAAVREAEAGQSARSREAGLFAVVAKPFDLNTLLAVVARAVGSVAPFDRSNPRPAAPAGTDAPAGTVVGRVAAGGTLGGAIAAPAPARPAPPRTAAAPH